MQDLIPKRILQTGKHTILPLRERAMVSNIKLLHPDYEYIFFDDEAVERFVEREFPCYRDIFRGFPHRIQRYDFFRYLAVYRYGGFYLDLDVLLASSISSLLGCGCVFPFEGLTFSDLLRNHHQMDWEIGNYAFGAVQGHPFLEMVIENCVRAQRDPSWVKAMMRGAPPMFGPEFVILNSTGPGLLSRTFAEYPDLAGTVTVLFPDDVCDVRSWNHFGDLGVHLMSGSWRTRRGRVRRRIAQYWELWKLKRVLKHGQTLGKTRHHVQAATHGSTIMPDPQSRNVSGQNDEV